VEDQLLRTRDCLRPFHPAASELERLIEFLHARQIEKQPTAHRRHR
jgi:hypothetical protein